MRLYCWPHQTVHDIAPADVERVVYALSAAYTDALTDPGGVHDGEDPVPLLPCPVEVVRWAGDSEMFAEHVAQGLECRVLGDAADSAGTAPMPGGGAETPDEMIARGSAASALADAAREETQP